MKTILRKSSETSFLKDAIRDLVIVVVGILAALWLESWWQGRLDRQEEQQILSNLRSEFVESRSDLADVRASIQVAIVFVDDLMRLINNADSDQDMTMISSYSENALPRFFDPRHGQLMSVINSGKLSLISSDELRALIAGWPTLATDMEQERTMFLEMMVHGPGRTFRQYVGNPQSKFDTDVESLISSRQFYNELGLFRLVMTIMERESQDMINSTDRIVDLIDQELEVA